MLIQIKRRPSTTSIGFEKSARKQSRRLGLHQVVPRPSVCPHLGFRSHHIMSMPGRDPQLKAHRQTSLRPACTATLPDPGCPQWARSRPWLPAVGPGSWPQTHWVASTPGEAAMPAEGSCVFSGSSSPFITAVTGEIERSLANKIFMRILSFHDTFLSGFNTELQQRRGQLPALKIPAEQS